MNDPRPPYLQVADDLRTGITGGTFKPGERLPSGRELARRYGVAPMTVHHAVSVLREERLVESYQGRGIFVTNGAAGRITGQGRTANADIQTLRADLSKLTDRVVRIERQLGKSKPRGADLS